MFEFLRDKRFNSKAYFAPIGPGGKRLDDGLKRNQPGGVLGGPIVNDRLFFFGAYQGTFLRVTPPDAITRIPSRAMLAGDFTAFASPACNRGQQITLRAPFVNNQVDPRLFSPAAMNIARQLPSTNDPCGDTRFSAPQHYDQGQMIGKVDYQSVGGSHSIFVRYMFGRQSRLNPQQTCSRRPSVPLNSPTTVVLERRSRLSEAGVHRSRWCATSY